MTDRPSGTSAPHGFSPGDPGTAERIADCLRQEITEGMWYPGSPMREVPLCDRLDVSRNTLREALRLLGAAGLVEFGLYRGASVREISPHGIGDIYTVRRTLELRAVDHSVHVDDAQLIAMESIIESIERSAKRSEWRNVATGSLRFHQALVGLLASPQLDSLFNNIVAQLRLVFSAAGSEEAFQAPWVSRDREVYDLVRRGLRQRAVEALSRYLDDSEQGLIDFLREHRYGQSSQRATTRTRQNESTGVAS